MSSKTPRSRRISAAGQLQDGLRRSRAKSNAETITILESNASMPCDAFAQPLQLLVYVRACGSSGLRLPPHADMSGADRIRMVRIPRTLRSPAVASSRVNLIQHMAVLDWGFPLQPKMLQCHHRSQHSRSPGERRGFASSSPVSHRTPERTGVGSAALSTLATIGMAPPSSERQGIAPLASQCEAVTAYRAWCALVSAYCRNRKQHVLVHECAGTNRELVCSAPSSLWNSSV